MNSCVPKVFGSMTPPQLELMVAGRWLAGPMPLRQWYSSAKQPPGQRTLGTWSAFNAATTASAAQLRASLAVLPELAEAGLVGAGKDISMAGTCGSLAMLLETSGVGAVLELERIPAPPEVEPLRWLTAFPSFGYVLAVDDGAVRQVCARFDAVGVACAPVGHVTESAQLALRHAGEQTSYLDLAERPLTGFGGFDQ